MSLTIRAARPEDDAALAELDRRCWAVEHEVVPRRRRREPFFAPGEDLAGFLVAERGGGIVGWVKIAAPTPLASNAHVRQIQGLGVDGRVRRNGVGRALIEAACELARSRGARRIWLRVLSTNPAAQRLYASTGFTVEGVLPGEFRLAGRDVDDVLMGRPL
jgi:ribosomal protein S18 acetylase RimI-like enzyme